MSGIPQSRLRRASPLWQGGLWRKTAVFRIESPPCEGGEGHEVAEGIPLTGKRSNIMYTYEYERIHVYTGRPCESMVKK